MIDESLPVWRDFSELPVESRAAHAHFGPSRSSCSPAQAPINHSPNQSPTENVLAVRPIRANRSRRPPGRGRAPRRRRSSRRGRAALDLAVGRGARRGGRGIAALRRRRRGLARSGRPASGGGLDQRPQSQWPRCARRARRRHGARRARGRVRRLGRSGFARPRFSRSRSARSRHAGGRRARSPRAPSRGRRAWRQRREQIRRRLGHRGHRRHGVGDEPRICRRHHRLAALGLDVGDCRHRHRHGAGLRFLLGAARRRPRSRGQNRPHRRRARGRARSIRAKSRRGGCRWCSMHGFPVR